jgi:hypothetical protein
MKLKQRIKPSWNRILIFFLFFLFVNWSSILFANTKFYKDGLKIAKILSPVEIIDVKGEPVDSSVGSDIMPGSMIRTGDGALCVLASSDGDNMTLDEDTEIRIIPPSLGSLKEGSVALMGGRAHFQVRHNPNSPMRVRTAVNMLTVRGTHFSTIYRGETFRLEVLEGVVEASFFDSPDEIISTAAGKMLDARDGVKMKGIMTKSKKKSMNRVKVFGDKAAASVLGDAAKVIQKQEQKKAEEQSSQDSSRVYEFEDSLLEAVQEVIIQQEVIEDSNTVPVNINFDVTSGDVVE